MKSYHLMMTPRSPFARRVRIALKCLGIAFDQDVLDVFKPTDRFLQANPLGLIPVLLVRGEGIEGELRIPDSAAILEFLNENHGRRIWPSDPLARARMRAISTLAEGVMAATVAHYLETQRSHPDEGWLSEHLENIHRALEHLRPASLDPMSQAGLDLAVALEYAELRLPEFKSGAWRNRYPEFVGLMEHCRKSPEFADTAPPPA